MVSEENEKKVNEELAKCLDIYSHWEEERKARDT